MPPRALFLVPWAARSSRRQQTQTESGYSRTASCFGSSSEQVCWSCWILLCSPLTRRLVDVRSFSSSWKMEQACLAKSDSCRRVRDRATLLMETRSSKSRPSSFGIWYLHSNWGSTSRLANGILVGVINPTEFTQEWAESSSLPSAPGPVYLNSAAADAPHPFICYRGLLSSSLLRRVICCPNASVFFPTPKVEVGFFFKKRTTVRSGAESQGFLDPDCLAAVLPCWLRGSQEKRKQWPFYETLQTRVNDKETHWLL